MHPHFDGHGPGFTRIEAEQFGHTIAQGQAKDVVQDDDGCHEQANVEQARCAEGYDAADEDEDAGDDDIASEPFYEVACPACGETLEYEVSCEDDEDEDEDADQD